jgi:hypothetical protein
MLEARVVATSTQRPATFEQGAVAGRERIILSSQGSWIDANMIHRPTNAVNLLNSAWFKSDTAQYFMSPRIQDKILYSPGVALDGDILRLLGAVLMNKLMGVLESIGDVIVAMEGAMLVHVIYRADVLWEDKVQRLVKCHTDLFV